MIKKWEVIEKATGEVVYGNECADDLFDKISQDLEKYQNNSLYEIMESDVTEERRVQDIRRKRQREYPTLEEAVHALLDGGEALAVVKAKRQEIKDKYPF